MHIFILLYPPRYDKVQTNGSACHFVCTLSYTRAYNKNIKPKEEKKIRSEKTLTIFEGAALVAGTGIGSGVMAIPFLFEKAGLCGGLFAFAAAFLFNVFLNFLVADITMNTGFYDIPSIWGSVLGRCRIKKQLAAVVYVFVAAMLIVNLSAYIVGGAEVVADLFPIAPSASRLLFYTVSMIPVLFGLKVIGISEKYLICAMAGLVLVFAVVSAFHPQGALRLNGTVPAILSAFSMIMFSMSSMFAVPEVVRGLKCDRRKIKRAIQIGLLINLVVSLLICFSVILSSDSVTEMAAIGWSRSLGAVIHIPLSVFILFAMMTSFWTLSFAFANMIRGKLQLNQRFCYLIATLPSLLISFVPAASFSGLAKMAAGIISILVGLAMIPAYRRSARLKGESPLLGAIGTKTGFLAVMIIGNLLMAVGSLC